MTSIQLKLPFPPEEIWKDIPGWEGKYQASQDGKIKRVQTGRVLKQAVSQNGYLNVSLYRQNVPKNFSVHRIILLTFEGERPEGMVINHKNGNKSDNRLENLEYCTQLTNIQHSIAMNGNPVLGVKNYLAKLNNDKVKAIRTAYASGSWSISALARKYNVSSSVIHGVVHHKSWRHVE